MSLENDGVTKVTTTSFPVTSKKKKTTTTAAAPKLSAKTFDMHFILERETKGAVRYMQVREEGDKAAWLSDEGAQVGTVYFRKSAFADGNFPKAITLTALYY